MYAQANLMAHPLPASRIPRGVSAVLLGRGRFRWRSHASGELAEVRAANGEFAPGELESALRGLVEAKSLHGRVVIGFEPEMEFFATERKTQFLGRSGSMIEALVAELGQDMVGRELDTSLAPELFSTAVLVPGEPARESRRALGKLRQSSVKLISTTHALLQAAESGEPKLKRRAEAEIRVLLGDGCGMALLAQEGDLLARHVFEFSQAREFAVLSAVRRLLGVARDSLHLATDPEVILHAEDELLRRVCAELTVSGRSAAPIFMDAAWICAALAECAFRRGSHVDVLRPGGRSLGKEPAPLPMRGLLAAAGAIAAAGFWLNTTARALDAEMSSLDRGASEIYERFGDDLYELRDHEEQLSAAAYLASAFAVDRVRWAPLLEELPRLLPAGAAMDTVEGSYPFWFEAGDPAMPPPADEVAINRWLELDATVSAASGDAPPEIQTFTTALRESEVLRSCFRRVTGAGVVLHEEDEHPWVEARVRCLAR